MSARPRRTIDQLLEAARGKIVRLRPEEAASAASAGGLIIDIRSDRSRERDGVIPGALHIPRTVLEWRADPDSPIRNPEVGGLDRQLLVVCEHGYSSGLAAATLVERGFEGPGDIIGGFEGWRAAGLPVGRPRPHPTDGVVGMGQPD